MYLLVFAFVADFSSDALEFYQHMRRIPDKKSSHEIKYRNQAQKGSESTLKKKGEAMLITRECDYAVRIVRALAGGQKICVTQICEEEVLTPAFVYKILKKMEKAELVKSYRGSNGGYALNKGIDEITLMDIYRAVEPEFFMIECMNPDKPCVRNQGDGCKVHKELCRIQKVLIRELSAKTIKKIIEA